MDMIIMINTQFATNGVGKT